MTDTVSQDVKGVLDKLAWHRQQGHNVLTADISFENANGLYSPVIETVTLSANPDDKDVYLAQKMLRVHTHGIEKLAVTAIEDPAARRDAVERHISMLINDKWKQEARIDESAKQPE